MSAPPFAHLHVHTEYSILDGACQVTPLVELAGNLGMQHIGITDHGTMAGTIEMYKKAKAAGIHPVLGMEAYVSQDHLARGENPAARQRTHLTLLARNDAGFRNLMKLSSTAAIEGYYYRPRIDYDLMSKHSEGIIALSGCMASQTQRYIAEGNTAAAREEVDRLSNIFGRENFYLEFQDGGIPEQKMINEQLRAIQRDSGLDAVVTADVHYLTKDDAVPHDALLCIQTKAQIADEQRFRFSTQEFYLKSPEEMYSEFDAYPSDWVARSVEIAERCQLDISLGTNLLPAFPTPDGKTDDEYLRELCEEGMRRRYPNIDGDLETRLTFELETISKMGYSAYFLITWDWIIWAKDQGIAVGPGRGSAAGSMVAYVLGITDVDPIKYDLLFERFLNPDRVSMPDIDTDVSQAGRERCIQYLAERYGRDHVAQISTFGRMQPKAAVKDAARVMGYPAAVGDKVSKMIPDGPGMSFKNLLVKGQDLKKAYDSDETTRAIVDLALPLEGVVRNSSIHAAAVVIGDRPLTDIVPLRGGDHGEVITQVAQDDVEALGLLKMDVLGLRNLDVLEKVVEFIEQSQGERIDVGEIPLDDVETLQMIASGENVGVFQLESPGMSGAARQIGPTKFEDIVALVAMYRPGPMIHIPTYAANKRNPGNVTYPDPRLESILAETYGINCYQEQYMKMARVLANFTPGEADDLRKGIAKKKRDVLDKLKEKFLVGCANNNVAATVAQKLWDDVERAGDYSFNKSHSVCYALISYQTAYLKCHYPAEYMAALISTVMHTKDRVPYYVSGARSMGINVQPPDVNESFSDFRVTEEGIRFGLTAVKGVGREAVGAIVVGREQKPYSSIWDFCERVDMGQLNKRVLEALIKAGALDSTGDTRKSMLEYMPQALAAGQKKQQDAAAGQFDLFGEMGMGGDDAVIEHQYPSLPKVEFEQRELLQLEREATGLYMSGHPLQEVADDIAERTDHKIAELEGQADRTVITVGGIVSSIRQLTTRKGDPMAFVQLEDLTGSIRLVVLPNVYEQARERIQGDPAIVIVRAKVDRRDENLDLVADAIMRIEEAPKLNTITLTASESDVNAELVSELRRIVKTYPGEANVDIVLRKATGEHQRVRFGQDWRVNPDSGFAAEIGTVDGVSVMSAVG
jgi:DNA polymerase-3 subunit alpha